LEFNEKKVKSERTAGIICSVIGWIMVVYGFYNLINFFILVSRTGNGSFVEFAIAFSLIFIGIIIVSTISYNFSRIKVYKMYFAILSTDPTRSIANLAACSNIQLTYPLSAAYNSEARLTNSQRNLMKLINKGYFPKGTYIDLGKNRLVLPCDASENTVSKSADGSIYITAICKNCGAANKMVKGSAGECEYCGCFLNNV